MPITIFGVGSQGDILPCVRLGRSLQQAGLPVLLAVPQNVAGLVQRAGLPCHPLRGDIQQIMASATGQDYMQSGGTNPIRSIRTMHRLLGPIALSMAEDVLAACQHAEALISLAVFAPFAATVAALRGIPLVLIEPTPLLPTGVFPAPGWPIQRNLGRWHNRLSGFLMLGVIWQWYRPFVNTFRRRCGLGPFRSDAFYRLLTSVPLLGAYSPAVIPRPADWPQNVQLTGYWFQDDTPDWHPPTPLQDFLAQGEPPIYVGFGSMAGRNPGQYAEIVLAALAHSGRRGILATGWGGLRTRHVPKDVFVLQEAPRDWLFPQMATVVHHGGAGTTAEGLRAGKPTVIIPFIVDQYFWGTRVQALGVGPAPLAAQRLTPLKLAHALHQASDPALRQRVQALGSAIRAEQGLQRAVAIIRQSLGV